MNILQYFDYNWIHITGLSKNIAHHYPQCAYGYYPTDIPQIYSWNNLSSFSNRNIQHIVQGNTSRGKITANIQYSTQRQEPTDRYCMGWITSSFPDQEKKPHLENYARKKKKKFHLCCLEWLHCCSDTLVSAQPPCSCHHPRSGAVAAHRS